MINDEELSLEAQFQEVVTFSVDEIKRSSHRWKFALFGKFLGQGFSLDFMQQELRARWNIEGDFNVCHLEDLLLFQVSSRGNQG